MRFMVIVKATKESEASVIPSEQLLTEMGKFNEALVKAGVMLAGDGLHPSSKGTRVKFSGNKRTVINGPFAETKELIAGYWIWQCKSKEEAVEWAKRCPNPAGDGRKVKSRFVRSSRLKTSAPSSHPSSENRRNASAHRWLERSRPNVPRYGTDPRRYYYCTEITRISTRY